MELRQLKYFEAVASTLSFSRASERLHIAQPPLSRQIQQLEDELGVQLLDRATRPLKLTNAGTFFYDQTVKILSQINEMQEATRRLGAGGRRWMGIGFVPSSLYGVLPGVVRQFSTDNDYLDVSLLELTSVQQAEALKSGRIDVGFSRLAFQDASLENIILTNERLIVAMQAHCELTKEQSIPLKRLLDEVLVLYPAVPRPSFADQILGKFNAYGYSVRKIYETNGLQTALGLVAAGIGVCIVPESAQRLRSYDVAYRPLAEKDLTSPLIMTIRAGDTTNHVHRFCKAIIEAMAPNSSEPRLPGAKPGDD